MPIALALETLKAKSAQCDSLIANAHKLDIVGVPLFPAISRKQITVAAFLNLYIAWEEFLEGAMSNLMAGSPTLSGNLPVRFVSPPNANAARLMVIGINRHFDYADHEKVRRVVLMYFQNGYPFEPHLSSIASDLADLRTMRNSSAHLSSTTKASIEGMAQRVFGAPCPGIDLYTMLTRVDPRSGGGETVMAAARDRLLVAAQLISTG